MPLMIMINYDDLDDDNSYLTGIDAEPVEHFGQLASFLFKLICLHWQCQPWAKLDLSNLCYVEEN